MEFGFSLFLSGVFVVLALIVNERNARYLLSGYNTMTEERRKDFDIRGYIKEFRRFFISLSIANLIISVVMFLSGLQDYSVISSLVLMFVTLPYLIIKGQRYDHHKSKRHWLPGYIAIAVLIIVGAGTSWMISAGLEDNEFVVANDHVEIEGMYGEEIPFQEINSANLVDALPVLVTRTNGFALAKHLKGYFRAENGKTVKLFVNGDLPPFLELKTLNMTYYWNASGNKTVETFRQVQPLVNGQH